MRTEAITDPAWCARRTLRKNTAVTDCFRPELPVMEDRNRPIATLDSGFFSDYPAIVSGYWNPVSFIRRPRQAADQVSPGKVPCARARHSEKRRLTKASSRNSSEASNRPV